MSIKELHFTLSLQNINRTLFNIKNVRVWGSWNCNRSNIAQIIPVRFKENGDAEHDESSITFIIPFPNRKFHSIDSIYIKTGIELEKYLVSHGRARFEMINFKKSSSCDGTFVDYLAPKNQFYSYGELTLTLKESPDQLHFDKEIMLNFEEMQLFCKQLIQQRRKYWAQFRNRSDEIKRVIFDVYMTDMGILMPAEIYPTIKQIPPSTFTLKKMINVALRVYGISEETCIKSCNVIGMNPTYTCEQLLTYNALALFLCMHGLGMNYHRDVDINPSTRVLIGNESLLEGDVYHADDCDAINRTILEITNPLIDYNEPNPDKLLLAIKNLLKHYMPMMISTSAEKAFLDSRKHAEKSSDFNGHITCLLIPLKHVFKRHPVNLPEFKQLSKILSTIERYEARDHLQVLFVECTGPEEPIFRTKITLLGKQVGEQCIMEIKNFAEIMVDNPIFESLTVPVLQYSSYRNRDESPNNFIRFISVGIWSRFVEPIEDIKNVEMRPFVEKKENNEIFYVHGCTMNELIDEQVFWIPSPALDEVALKNLSDWIPHIPRVPPFEMTSCPKKIPSLKRKGSFEICDSYLLPVMIKFEDFDDEEIIKVDDFLYNHKDIEAYQWNLAEMGVESILFLTCKVKNKEKALANIQQKVEKLIYDKKNKVMIISGKYSKIHGVDYFTIHMKNNNIMYAVSFHVSSEKELQMLVTFFANFADIFNASIIFKEGMTISFKSKKLGTITVHVENIDDIRLLEYKNSNEPIVFGTHMMENLFKKNIPHITSPIDAELNPQDDQAQYQFNAMNNTHAYSLQMKNNENDIIPSLKHAQQNIQQLSISRINNITYPNSKYQDEMEKILLTIQNQQIHFYYFSSISEFISFLPPHFDIVISYVEYEATVNIYFYYFHLKDNIVKLGIQFKDDLNDKEKESMKKVHEISVQNETLLLNKVPLLRFKVNFQIIINQINENYLINGNFTLLNLQWSCDDFNHHHAKDRLIFFQSSNPQIINHYFEQLKAYSYTAALKKGGFIFLTSHNKNNSYHYMAVPDDLPITVGRQVEIYIHNNLIFIGDIDNNNSTSNPIPSDVYFISSNFALKNDEFYQLVRMNLADHHSIELQQEEVLVHFVPINALLLYSYCEQYFFIYFPFFKAMHVLFYHEKSATFMIHAVDLIFDQNFILSRDEKNNVLISSELLKKTMGNCCTMLNSEKYAEYIEKAQFDNVQLAYFIHRILHFISEKVEKRRNSNNVVLDSSDICINFFKIFFKVQHGQFKKTEDLQAWWDDSHISIREKLLYLMYLILHSSLDDFSFIPFCSRTISIELRNIS